MGRIFVEHEPCPCLFLTDMEASGDVYSFLEEYYSELHNIKKWKRPQPKYLECTHCIFSRAYNIVKDNPEKYSGIELDKLEISMNIISKAYLLYKRIDEF